MMFSEGDDMAAQKADRLLSDGKITLDDYKRIVSSNARFLIEEARFERDEARLRLEDVVNSETATLGRNTADHRKNFTTCDSYGSSLESKKGSGGGARPVLEEADFSNFVVKRRSSDKLGSPPEKKTFVNAVRRVFRRALSSSSKKDGGSEEDEEDEAASAKDPLQKPRLQRVKSSILQLPAATEQQPFKPADFERLRRVGRGGFGTVYLVRKKEGASAGRCYAMKVLKKRSVLRATGGESRAKLERDVLRVLKSPFVARLRLAFQTESRLYLLTDYYVGGCLKAMLRATTGGRCTVEATRFYAAELTAALTYLHKKNIVHRDVKPSNVLVDRRGHVALCDFGIAAVKDEQRQHNSFAGTIEYMAPELLKKRHDRDPAHAAAVDWWSLGVMCYELIKGVTPFHSKQPRELFMNILRKQPNFEGWMDEDAVSFLVSLLEKHARDRGGASIKSHAFFKNIDFDKISKRLVEPPHVPHLPPFISFDADGRLLCSEKSKHLPNINADGESDDENASVPNVPMKSVFFKDFTFDGDTADYSGKVPA